MMLLMNPLDLTYCETSSWLYMAQPWNTISNGLFFIIAFVLYYQIKQTDKAQDKSFTAVIASIALIGACSTFWHATMYPWALLVDIFGIIVFTIAYIYYVGLKQLSFSFWQSTGTLIAVIALCVFAMKLTDGLPQRSGAFIPLSLLFFVAAIKLWKNSKQNSLYLIGAGGTMALAIVARVIDVSVCDYIPVGTHFLWHGLTAVTTYCLMMPVLRSLSYR